MRISKYLERKGVPEEWQLTIYGTCMRDRKGKTSTAEHKRIEDICKKIGGSDSAGLYRYLTDKYINHDYIRMNYGIPKDHLFKLRHEFYMEWVKDFSRNPPERAAG